MTRSSSGAGQGSVKEALQLFCLLAVDRGCMSETQVMILLAIGPDRMDVDGFVALASIWNLGPKRTAEVAALGREIRAFTPAEITARLKERQAMPAKVAPAAPLELEWFCYAAVRESLLTETQCLELDAELGRTRDFLGFAQAVVQHLPREMLPKVQALVERSMEYANTGRRPPKTIF